MNEPEPRRMTMTEAVRAHLRMHPDHRASDLWQENTLALFEAALAEASAPALDAERLARVFHSECFNGDLGTPHPRLPPYSPAACDCVQILNHMLAEYARLEQEATHAANS